jgi:hypothetical protein
MIPIKQQLIDVMKICVLMTVTGIFAVGGILSGCLFNYITTGVWFL